MPEQDVPNWVFVMIVAVVFVSVFVGAWFAITFLI